MVNNIEEDERIRYLLEYVEFICELLPFNDQVELAINYNGRLLVDKEHYDIALECRKNGLMGRTFPIEKLIYVDLNLCNNDTEYIVITRGLRHIYQWFVVNNNDTELEKEELIKVWRDNFDNYIPYDINASQEDNLKQELQPLEIDANCFTDIVLNTLYGINTKMIVKHVNSNEDYATYYKYISEYNYSKEEIKDIASDFSIKKKLNVDVEKS